ncbi:hypothetical protein [Nonlabens xiamenensis]|uniref:hypothetical protein n=1 Tax=Nonlabens xiamenensis TaxID=2341043 RepID=UPI000F6099CC|nr:hypothetical protein [Nonlabens xiamenensis]
MYRLLCLLVCLVTCQLSAQIGIGTTNPDPAAVLDIHAEISPGHFGGLKLPTVNSAQRDLIATPIPDGMMIYYREAGNRCVQLYDAQAANWVNFYCMNAAPVASGTSISYTDAFVGEMMSFDAGSFTQTDAEADPPGARLYQWFRADDTNGLNEVPISGATAADYTLTTADDQKFIRLAVTPTATTGASPGVADYSSYSHQVTFAPTKISMVPQSQTVSEAQSPNAIELEFSFPYVSSTPVQIELVASDYTRLAESGTVTVTIPAQQTSPFRTSVFHTADNALTDGNLDIIFSIDAVYGGLGANSIGAVFQDTWTILDDETIPSYYINEDFETDGNGIRYTTSTAESISGTDYFSRTNDSGVSGTYNHATGYFFAAQDIDAVASSPTQSIIFNPISIAGTNTFNYSIDLAEDDDGTNQDWDAADYFIIQYSLDGSGTWIDLFEVAGAGTNAEPSVVLNTGGTQTGDVLTDNFTTFTGSFSAAGTTSIQFRLKMSLDAGDEDIAIDNFMVN